MSTSRLCLAVIIVITILLIASFAWFFIKKRRAERFSYSTPATPRLRESADGLFACLDRLAETGKTLKSQIDRLPDATSLADVRLKVENLIHLCQTTKTTFLTIPPTYANYLAIYRGFVSTDTVMQDAADTFKMAGDEVNQGIARTSQGPPAGDYADVAGNLKAFGRELRMLTVWIHRLGAALDVE